MATHQVKKKEKAIALDVLPSKGMVGQSCPFLGLKDDAHTSFAFPSQWNYCHKTQKASAVTPQHQQLACLATHHTDCPVFAASQPRKLPTSIQREAVARITTNQLKVGLIITGVLIGVMILVAVGIWQNWEPIATIWETPISPATVIPATHTSEPTSPNEDIPSMLVPIPRKTGGKSLEIEGMSEPDLPAAASPTPLPLNIPSTAPILIPCGPPPGWTQYRVQPGDTLFSLAIRHAITIDQLQQANCLTVTTIQVGQTLFVPFFIEATAIPDKIQITPSAAATTTLSPTSTETETLPPTEEQRPAPTEPTSPPPTPTAPLPPTPTPSPMPTEGPVDV